MVEETQDVQETADAGEETSTQAETGGDDDD